MAAFASLGPDSPTSSPVNSINPGFSTAGSCPCLKSLQMDFDSTVSSVSIFVLDFSGDGAIQEVSLSAPSIYRVRIDSDTTNDNGIAFDDLSFVH